MSQIGGSGIAKEAGRLALEGTGRRDYLGILHDRLYCGALIRKWESFIKCVKNLPKRDTGREVIAMAMLDFIQNYLRCDLLDTAMPLFTRLGDGGILWIVCSVSLLAFPGTRKAGAAMALSLALEALCCNALLKPLVARVRPCDVNTAVQLLIPRPRDFSFPSGHTGAAFAAASSLFFSGNRMWSAAFALAALLGFSRLYLYVHYPSDVLAGALLGITLGWLANTLAEAVGARLKKGQGFRE